MTPRCQIWLMVQLIGLAVAAGAAPQASGQIFDAYNWQETGWKARGEYLYWWTNGNTLPALVTTSPPGTPQAQAGVLGTPGAEILFGGETIDSGPRSGGRVTLSRWLEDEAGTFFDFVGFYVADDYQAGDYLAESTGTPIVSRPFFNVGLNQEDAELVAFPNILAGRVTVESYSEMYSAAVLVRRIVGEGPRGHLDVLAGYRYLRYRETLSIRENLVSTNPGGLIPLGTTTDLIDSFATGNDFHGAEFGLSTEYLWSAVSLELLATLALGQISRHADLAGSTVVTIPGSPSQTTPGGLLTQPTNSGRYSDQNFGVLPELGLNANVLITPNVSLLFGYTLVVLNDVVRSGEQIDRGVNVSQIGGQPLVGDARPAFAFRDSNLVVQGLSLGLEGRW